MQRSAGVLMPVSSLPSKYGIGTLGKEAYKFADFLKEAGQKYWQMLPLVPGGPGNSPYSSFSTFAGNPFFIDLDLLIEDGLLDRKYVESFDWGADPENVDYDKIQANRREVLYAAYQKGWERDKEEVHAFRSRNAWAEDYAFYRALKVYFHHAPWTEWDEDIKRREPAAMEKYKDLVRDNYQFYSYVQYLFFTQWEALRKYVHDCGILLIGDMPFYVALDSADVWKEPQFFQLGEDCKPTDVAGVPPDYFSEDGQLWGNPLYAWDAMRRDGWGWWIRRVEGASKLYDVIRIDHFRAFASYWSVPADESTAKNGQWKKAPGMDIVGTLCNWFYGINFIAEDLGILTPDVEDLIRESGIPGMNVLQFAFSPDCSSRYLPHSVLKNSIMYVGTHDNDTTMGWLNNPKITPEEKQLAHEYLGLSDSEPWNIGVIRGGMVSPSDLFICQMQDWLGLGTEARMNTPGTPEGNWTWRMKKGADSQKLAEKMRRNTRIFGRG